jgi:hypothetical protein
MKNINPKFLVIGVLSLIAIVIFTFINPFAWNDASERTVVQQTSGNQFVQYKSGVYYAGFFAKTTQWPNQISVSYQDSVPNMELNDGTIEIGKVTIRFGADATSADVSGIVQYVLPSDEKEMIEMHNAHKTPQSLVSKRLAPYTKECLQSSAQMMSSEMHYSGGRSTMSQDFGDQLRNGVFILKTSDKIVFDSLENEKKKIYVTDIIVDKNNNPKRKGSSIKEYGITIADAAITDVDYETRVDVMLGKKIDAATAASIAKQQFITAQQQALTAKAQGEKQLVETEYKEKQIQTQQVVKAETTVKLAEQDKLKQKIAAEAAILEAQKTRTDADAQAYANARLVSAGLSPIDRAEYEMKTRIGVAQAVGGMTLPYNYMTGSNGGGNASMLESILGVNLLQGFNTTKK